MAELPQKARLRGALMKHRRSGIFKKWDKRYFILSEDGKTLAYAQDDVDGAPLRGEFKLADMDRIRLSDQEVLCEQKTGNVIRLKASSYDEAEKWYLTLRECLEQVESGKPATKLAAVAESSSTSTSEKNDSSAPSSGGEAKPAAAAEPSEDEASWLHVRVIHVNDVYSLAHFPNLATLIKTERKAVKDGNCFSTLAGDFVAPSLLSTLDKGKGMINVMGATPIDYVCFGNHEKDNGQDSLLQRIREFKGKAWINSNMPAFEPSCNLPKYAVHPVKTKDGETKNVVLHGFLIGGGKFVKQYQPHHFGGAVSSIMPVLDCHAACAEEARKAVPDVVAQLPLTHQDLAEDIEMAKQAAKTGDWACVLAGHDHDVFCEQHDGVWMIKSGMDAVKATIIDMVWAKPDSKVDVSAKLVNTDDYAADPAVTALMERCMAPVRELQEAVLYKIPAETPLDSRKIRYGPSSFGRFISDALKTVFKTEIGLMTSAAVKGEQDYVEKGQITFADIKKELPYNNEVGVVELPGKLLSEIMAKPRTKWPEESPATLHEDNGVVVAGADEGFVIKTVNGEPLDPERMYSVACPLDLFVYNDAVKAYEVEHPGTKPPEDNGRHIVEVMVEFLCNKLWVALVDTDGDGDVSEKEVVEFFKKADKSGDGEVDEAELKTMLTEIIGEGSSGLVASQMIALFDSGGDKTLSLDEVKKVAEKL